MVTIPRPRPYLSMKRILAFFRKEKSFTQTEVEAIMSQIVLSNWSDFGLWMAVNETRKLHGLKPAAEETARKEAAWKKMSDSVGPDGQIGYYPQ